MTLITKQQIIIVISVDTIKFRPPKEPEFLSKKIVYQLNIDYILLIFLDMLQYDLV